MPNIDYKLDRGYGEIDLSVDYTIETDRDGIRTIELDSVTARKGEEFNLTPLEETYLIEHIFEVDTED